MKRPLVFTDWLVENPPPSLAALIEQHGGFIDIPEDAWKQFLKDAEAWRIKLRDRDK